MSKLKKIIRNIGFAALGLALPYLSYAALIDTCPDPRLRCAVPTNPAGLITTIIQIVLGFAGVLAVLFIIIGGFQYITSGGNEELAERGKKNLQNAIIGVVIIILSFVIVRVIANTLAFPGL